MNVDSLSTEVIIENLRKRAEKFGDDFQIKGTMVDIRCFQPDKHKNADDHISAFYHMGKYAYCRVCGFKEGQNKLADRLGIGKVEGGLTLTELAHAKRLSVPFLQSWGWRSQAGRDGRFAVLIPWYDEKGVLRNAPAYHIRHFIHKGDGTGPRYTWDLPKNARLKPYGFWRFREYQETALSKNIPPYIIIAESELDALTGWLHDIPVCATGGADGFKAEWTTLFSGFNKIVIAQEPGNPGELMVKRIVKAFTDFKHTSESQMPEILICRFHEENKDMNALHLSVDGDNEIFLEKFKELVLKSISADSILNPVKDQDEPGGNKRDLKEHQRLMDLARPLLCDPELLHKAIITIENQGVVGERRNIGIIHLAVRSRALKRPVNIEVNSPSSTGKTYVVLGTLALEHPSSYYELTAGSEKALIYLNDSLKNRFIYMQEPEGLADGVGAAVIKSLVWEGRLKYDTVVKSDGEMVGQHIEKEGPTGLIVCTTRPLEEQISNRHLRVELDASEEQTKRILISIAAAATGQRTEIDLEPWQALSLILGDPAEVSISFGPFLATKISTATLRIRRDFTHLLTLIGACAVEYRFQRKSSLTGRIEATLADYAMVHALVADTFRDIQADGITLPDREMVTAIIDLSTPSGGKPGEIPITQAALRSSLKLCKSSTSYRIKRLLKLGYVANQENRKGMEMKLVPGAPLPEKPEPLPSPCELAQYLANQGFAELISPWADPLTGEIHDCNKHLDKKYFNTPLTTSRKAPEPCPAFEASSDVGEPGFIAVEPSEPPNHQGSKVQGVLTKLNPDHLIVNPRLENNEGSKPPIEEQQGSFSNVSSQSSRDEDWGEV